MTFRLPIVYPITDARLSGLSHAEQIRQLIDGGATLVQLREKSASPQEFYETALAVMKIAHAHGMSMIINDRVDIALAVKADGVHLGQDDLPPAKARQLLGNKAMIGLSTHNLEQAKLATKEPVDYIAIGPIFATSSKQDPDPVVGLDGLAAAREAIPEIPLVAIGGINAENIASVLSAGADSAAMIGAILSPANRIADNYRSLAAAAKNKNVQHS